MNYEVLADARAELEAGAAFYERCQHGLAQDFLDNYADAVQQILAAPDAWSRISKRARRVRLKRFPYAIIYRQRDAVVQIIAVAHLHRGPKYWRSILNRR
jgi:plasmid stabilization system protein ParE